MTRYLVTGGAGFIGSHIAEGLVRRGDRVRILDDLSTGKLDNIAAFRDAVEFVECGVLDPRGVRSAMEGVDCVFHQAALASVPLSVECPLDSHAACATGTLAVLDAARRSGVRRVVYASSSSLYGDQPNSAKRETDLPAPLSPYGAAKLSGEYYCRAAYHTYGLETVCLRYFNVFGPRQDPGSPYSAVIPLFLTAMLGGRQPVIYGDGKQSRDFTFVGNVVEGNLRAASTADAAGRSFNIANGRATDLLTLVANLNELLGLDIQPQFAPPRVGDIRDSMADITLARRVLEYEPRYDFREGLERSIPYYREWHERSTAGASVRSSH
ncbi:MAG: SDR family oxidoreductase [Planctomycetes bacterium]|nr:SDR family oxidoreductase [Planctomycetota bacterium]